MRLLVAVCLLLLAALVQSEIGPALPLLGGRPDLPLVFVLAWAVQRGANEGAIVGFVAGLLLDSVGYTPFGLNAALLGIAGYVTGLPEANVYRGNFPFFVGIAVLITLAYHTLTFLALQAYGLQMPPVVGGALAGALGRGHERAAAGAGLPRDPAPAAGDGRLDAAAAVGLGPSGLAGSGVGGRGSGVGSVSQSVRACLGEAFTDARNPTPDPRPRSRSEYRL